MTLTTDRYIACPNSFVEAATGITYAYRRIGLPGQAPLVLLQHFRGNLDNWDPALIDSLSRGREVIAFDNVGVGATSGHTPSSVTEMAHDAITFVSSLGLTEIDLLGFSIGSFVAQEIALIRPSLVRRMVLASAAPRGAAGMHGWADHIIDAIGAPTTSASGYLHAFFRSSRASQTAGTELMARLGARVGERDVATTWETRDAQYDAVLAWGTPEHAKLERVSAITCAVFVANGDDDQMILPRFSHLLAGLLPDAELKLFHDSAHGFLFQHHAEFSDDLHAFLG